MSMPSPGSSNLADEAQSKSNPDSTKSQSHSQSSNKSQQESPSLRTMASQAEHDLNTYGSKTGHRHAHPGGLEGLEGYGVNDTSQKFPGSHVKVGEDLITNASYNRRIPPDEGGDIDDKGHALRGKYYEGEGGPQEKLAHIYLHSPGSIDESVMKKWGQDPVQLERGVVRTDRPDLLPSENVYGGRSTEPGRHGDISEQGRIAAKVNLGREETSRGEVPSAHGRGSEFRGEYYERSEDVPDQRADQGEVPPGSVIEGSHNI